VLFKFSLGPHVEYARLLPEDDRTACSTAVASFQLLEFTVIRQRLHYSKMAFRRPLLCASAASFQEVLSCRSDATCVAVAITRCSMNTRFLRVFARTPHFSEFTQLERGGFCNNASLRSIFQYPCTTPDHRSPECIGTCRWRNVLLSFMVSKDQGTNPLVAILDSI